MKIKENWTEEKGLILTIVILGILIIALFIYVYVPKSTASKQYSIDIIEITGDCKDCFDLKTLESEITKNNVKVKSTKTLDVNSEEARKLIEKYNIGRVPALIVLSKDIEKIGIDGEVFSINSNYALFDKSVPYIDLTSNEIKGIVDIKEIYDSSCKECFSISQVGDQLRKINVKIKNYETIDSLTDKGKNFIKENDLSFAPALFLSEGIEEYWWFFDNNKDSFVKKGKYYLYNNPIPPYKEISTGKIKGKVDVTYLVDKDCADCIKVEQLRSTFLSIGIYMDKEKTLDITSQEGKSLLKKYNITAVPTIILSKEISDYNVKDMLKSVGSFENDGKFIFRKLDLLKAKYRKLNDE